MSGKGEVPERLLTPKEFCEIMRISRYTFYEWVSKGLVKVIRTPTGKIRVPYSEVERILKGGGEGGGESGSKA